MPEGSEVLTIATSLAKVVEGQTIKSISFTNVTKKYDCDTLARVKGLTIERVYTKGKKIIFALSEGYLVSSLGMEGKWLIKKGKYTLITLKLDTVTIYYDDSRKFGLLVYCKDDDELANQLKGVGKDLLSENVTKDEFITAFRNPRRKNAPIIDLLLKQEIFSGVGNWVRCEALYRARIHPTATPSSLTDHNLRRLLKACKRILQQAYEVGGLTLKSFKGLEGEKGGYKPKVYGIKTSKVQHIKSKDRTIWWSEKKQTEGKITEG
jgi:formamidopyrimidine-DNA glycosylase